MGFHINPLAEAAREFRVAAAYRTLGLETRWRIIRWWYRARAERHEMNGYEWRGMHAVQECQIELAMKKATP